MNTLEKHEDGITAGSRDSFTASTTDFKTEPESQSPPGEQSQPTGDDTKRLVHGWKWLLVCLSLYTSALIYGLDTTIAADIQAAIIEQFDSVELLTWVGAGFPLGSFVAVLPAAAFYYYFDQKYFFIASVVLFEVGSALCGASPSMSTLIVGRVIAGVGGTGIYVGNLNYFSLTTTEKERGRYIAGIGAVWGLGAVLGPVVGGAFSSSSATWRWAFYINLVIAAIFAPAYIFFLPSVKPQGYTDESAFQKFKKMDWAGYICGTGFAVSISLALTFGGSIWPWNDGRTIATFVVFGVMFILTILQQYFLIFTTLEQRMFPPKHILSEYSLLLLNAVTALSAVNIFIPVYYIPVYFIFTHGDSAIEAAVRLLPYIVFLVVFNLLAGGLLSKINYYWLLFLVGGILMTVGAATMITVNTHTTIANIYGYSIMLGAGTGLTLQAGYTVGGVKTMIKTGSGLDVQRVISVINLSQISFQVLCLLVGGQIYQGLAYENLSNVLQGMGYSADDIRGAIAGTQSTLFSTLSPSLQEEATGAITSAISRVYIISVAAGALTVVGALMMKKERLFALAEVKTSVEDGA